MSNKAAINGLLKSTLITYTLIGFSICFSQLFASLYMARKIKSQQTETATIPIVFGGSSCSGDIGASLIAHFPEIDFLIDGEGEQNIVHLCRFLTGQRKTLPEKIHTQAEVSVPKAEQRAAPLDFNSLPYPDYTPYFQEMKQLFPGSTFYSPAAG